MLHSTRHGRVHKGPVFYVPESFRPETSLPQRLLLHAQSAYYLMHLILVRLVHGERDCARLKMKYLENVMGRRHAGIIRASLEESGDTCRVGGYREGQYAFGYLPGEKYRDQRLRPFHPTNPELLQRLARLHHEIDENGGRHLLPIHKQWEQWQTSLTIDINQARSAVATLPVASNPYDIQSLLIDRLPRQEYRFKVDDYGRVHNSITNLHRRIRPALRIHGEPTMHIDIVNSQPALLAVLIRQLALWDADIDHPSSSELAVSRFARRQVGAGGTACSAVAHSGGSGDPTPLSIYDRAPFGPTEGDKLYERLATSGRLYEHLMTLTGMSRAEVKVGLLRDVFGKRGHYSCPLEQVFRDDFAGVQQFIRWFNRDDHAALLRELQRVESDLVIHRVGKRLKELGCTGCVSLHDAVFCALDDINRIEQAFQDECDASGIQLKLEIAA